MEDRRKLVACLELCGKSDHEITRLLDGADRKGELSDDPFVPQRIQDYMDKAKVSFLFILKVVSTVQALQTFFSPFNLHSAVYHLKLHPLFTSQHDPSRFASLRRTVESARLEILALENQLNEQEKCHLEQIAMLENERRLNAKDREAERNQYEGRIAELSNQ